jgi:hypothetical protein
MSSKRSKQVKVSKRHVEKQRIARDVSRSRNAPSPTKRPDGARNRAFAAVTHESRGRVVANDNNTGGAPECA